VVQLREELLDCGSQRRERLEQMVMCDLAPQMLPEQLNQVELRRIGRQLARLQPVGITLQDESGRLAAVNDKVVDYRGEQAGALPTGHDYRLAEPGADCFRHGDLDEAEARLRRAWALAESLKHFRLMDEIHQTWADVYQAHTLLIRRVSRWRPPSICSSARSACGGCDRVGCPSGLALSMRGGVSPLAPSGGAPLTNAAGPLVGAS
jgi:hypothetical protein